MSEMDFTKSEIEEGAKSEKKEFALSYGIYKGVVMSAEITKDNNGNEKRTYRNGKPYYNVKLNIAYTNELKEDKERCVFIDVGPFSNWLPINKAFRSATGLSKDELLNTANYKNKDVGIKIGAIKAYPGYSGSKELFNGYFVGEYEGKKFISNGIIDFIPYREVKADESFMESEKKLREDFKNGIKDNEASKEDLDDLF